MVFKKPTDEYQWVFFMRLFQEEYILEINSQTLNKGGNISIQLSFRSHFLNYTDKKKRQKTRNQSK